MSKAALAVEQAVKAARPAREKKAAAAAPREALTKEQRQKVKLLLQRPDERRLLDTLLEYAMEHNILSGAENDVVHRLQARSAARRWE